jgi:hypothetical protein
LDLSNKIIFGSVKLHLSPQLLLKFGHNLEFAP